MYLYFQNYVFQSFFGMLPSKCLMLLTVLPKFIKWTVDLCICIAHSVKDNLDLFFPLSFVMLRHERFVGYWPLGKCNFKFNNQKFTSICLIMEL